MIRATRASARLGASHTSSGTEAETLLQPGTTTVRATSRSSSDPSAMIWIRWCPPQHASGVRRGGVPVPAPSLARGGVVCAGVVERHGTAPRASASRWATLDRPLRPPVRQRPPGPPDSGTMGCLARREPLASDAFLDSIRVMDSARLRGTPASRARSGHRSVAAATPSMIARASASSMPACLATAMTSRDVGERPLLPPRDVERPLRPSRSDLLRRCSIRHVGRLRAMAWVLVVSRPPTAGPGLPAGPRPDPDRASDQGVPHGPAAGPAAFSASAGSSASTGASALAGRLRRPQSPLARRSRVACGSSSRLRSATPPSISRPARSCPEASRIAPASSTACGSPLAGVLRSPPRPRIASPSRPRPRTSSRLPKRWLGPVSTPGDGEP